MVDMFHYYNIILLLYPGKEEHSMHTAQITISKAMCKVHVIGEWHAESETWGPPHAKTNDTSEEYILDAYGRAGKEESRKVREQEREKVKDAIYTLDAVSLSL